MNRLLSKTLFSAASTAYLPLLLARGLTNPRFRDTLAERLGRGTWRDEAGRTALWFHAASLGELEGATPVVRTLRSQLPSIPTLLTATSAAGLSAGRSKFPEIPVRIFPYDHPWISARLAKRVAPRAVVLFETEIWPIFLEKLQQLAVPTVVVNGRISDHSFPAYYKLRKLLRPAMGTIDQVFAQSRTDADRFETLGVPQEKIVIAGSTKYDQPLEQLSEEERARFRQELGFLPEKRVFVAGSVRPGEEELVIAAFSGLLRADPSAALLIAPRHKERFDAVAGLLSRAALPFVRRSSESSNGSNQIVLLDSLGELRKAYQIATVAFVGGTLVDIGGHNPMEPAVCGVPVLVGPSVQNVREAVNELQQLGGAAIVENGAELMQTLLGLYADENRRIKMAEAAKKAAVFHAGVTSRVIQYLCNIVELGASEPERLRAMF